MTENNRTRAFALADAFAMYDRIDVAADHIEKALDEAERRGLERGAQPLEALTLRELLDLSSRANAAVSRRILAGTTP